jgi:hypothetical protein
MALFCCQLPLKILHLQLVAELVEAQHVYPTTKAAGFRVHFESRKVGAWLLSPQPLPQDFVDHFLEALTSTASPFLELPCDIVIQSKSRSHAGIMMSAFRRVKMQKPLLKALGRNFSGSVRSLIGSDRSLSGYDRSLIGSDQSLSGYDQSLIGSDRSLSGYDRSLIGSNRSLSGSVRSLYSLVRSLSALCS